MDISNLTQNLIKGLEQKSNAELAALSRALNIALGKVAIANVTETAPVTPQERQELLNKTAEALVQLNKLASNAVQLTPAVKAEISRLLEQQALIKSPDLKWVNLVVNNRSILTYTDKPLVVGQAIPVQLVSAQKLVLLALPELNNLDGATKVSITNPNSLATTQSTTSSTYSAKSLGPNLTTAMLTKIQNALSATGQKSVPADELAKIIAAANSAAQTRGTGTTPTAPSSQPTTKTQLDAAFNTTKSEIAPNTENIKKIIAENLRQLLPQKDIPSVLFSAAQQWQQIPAATRQRFISPTVEQALKSVAEQIRSPLQLIQPKILAQIIKNSGVFFESTLNTNYASKIINSPNNPLLARTYSQDLKGSLLNLLSKVNQELNGNNKPLTTEQTVKLLQQLNSNSSKTNIPVANGPVASSPAAIIANGLTTTAAISTIANGANSPSQNITKNISPHDIEIFIEQLMSKPAREISNKELRTQLLVLLQQHSLHSLAKIQLQQLTSLNNAVETKDAAQPSASWQVDIPIRHQNDVQQLHVRIDRDWVDDRQASNENKTSSKVKQWSVTLRFDLPTLGEFCAQLAIVDITVSATLWAAQEKTFSHVREQIKDLKKNLEKEGIHVKHLQCMKGMPPEKPMALSYSLIDVST